MSTNGKRKRRTFSEEFKRDAVNLVVVEGYTIAAAAKAVNVLDGSLREEERGHPTFETLRLKSRR
jgi:transposase